MTEEQKRAIRTLSECRIWNRFHRGRVKAWATALLECPEADLMPHHDRALRDGLHTYRRQHGQCRCEKCFGTLMDGLGRPTQFSLFDTEGTDR